MPLAKDEVSRGARARRDPRAEPDSVPPVPSSPAHTAAVTDEVVEAARCDPRADPPSVPAMAAVREPPPAEPAVAPADPVDARFAELEPLFARSAWREIVACLGPADEVAKLPPALGLIYALAQREAAGEDRAAGATELAIRSMAVLVGVAPGSATALVLAKRLLRQNPAGWRTKPAPRARFSVLIIVVGVVVGAAVGWFASLGSVRLF
jgi:hypothetical protein